MTTTEGVIELTKQDRKLVKKLSEVMQEVKYIQKTGKNTFHKYTYATESDVAEHVREELAKRFVMMIPNVIESTMREHKNRSGNIEYIVKVRMEFKFIDGETGEEISFHTEGEGQDAGDKAVYKAMTGAQKYALLKVFMIPTGDDPEGDNGTDERNHQPQQEKPQLKQQQPKPNKPIVVPIKPDTVGIAKVLAMKVTELTNKEDFKMVNAFVRVTRNPDFKVSDVETLSDEQGKEIVKNLEIWVNKLEKEKEGATA